MTLRNVPNSFTLEQQRQEVNEIAVDLDTAVDGVQTFGGSKTFSNDVTFSSDVTFQAQASGETEIRQSLVQTVICCYIIQDLLDC